MVIEILKKKPENIHEFMIEFLKKDKVSTEA